jgi:hypothetical protein
MDLRYTGIGRLAIQPRIDAQDGRMIGKQHRA